MWVTIVLLCLATSAYARPEIIRPDEEAYELQALAQLDPQELQDFIEAEAQPDELNRKKKQTTTFCVEIRSSEHKPFQVCNPYHEKEYYPKYQHKGGEHDIQSQSGHSGGGNHVNPTFSTPIKTFASSESSRPPSKQSFEGPPSKQSFDGFQSNFPEVQNLGPARAATEDEMQIENEIPSQGAAKANKEELKFVDVPVPVRSAFEEDNEPSEDENPSNSSPARSASNADPVPAELKKADTTIDDPLQEEINEAPKDIGKAVKPSDENFREDVKDDVQDVKEEVKSDIKEEVKSDIKEEVKSDIKEVKSDINEVKSDMKEDVKTDIKEVKSDTKEEVKSDIKVDDKENVKDKDPTHIRAAESADAYKPMPEYGHQTQYIPYSPIHQNHHSGLVITCQPNLAGYAHKVPDPYYHQGGYHSGGHSAYNHRAADPTYGRPYHRHQAQYGSYKPYQSYRPQAQHYQGPAYHYPQPYHKAIQMHKPEMYKMDPYKQEQQYKGPQQSYDPYKQEQHYKPPQQSYDYYPHAPAYPQQPYYKPSEGFGHKTEDTKGEHHLRSSNVPERENERNEQKPFEEETKEQHTLKKMEDISKQRLGDSWVPEGMEEVFVGQPREASSVSEHDHLSNVGAKTPEEENFLNHNVEANEADEGGQRSVDHDSLAGEYVHPSHNGGAKEADEEENRNFDQPENENVHPDGQVNVKEAEEEGVRSASDFGLPESDNIHSDPKEIEGGGWRSASSPESDTGHFIHNNGVNEVENGPWRSASHAHHNLGMEDADGGWRSANRGSSEFEHNLHNVEIKSAENGGWRSAGYPAVSDHVHPSHNGHPESGHIHPGHVGEAKSAENGGWRSASNPAVSDHVHPSHIGHPVDEHIHPQGSDLVHPSHNDGAKAAENEDWRSANYPLVTDHVHPSHNGHLVDEHIHPPGSDLVHPSHNGGAKSAENGGWIIINDDFPVGEGEGLREAQGENVELLVGQPNGSMKDIQGEASRDPNENESLENRIEES